MGECPSKECHSKVQGIAHTLYGLDGREGLARDIEKKVERNELERFVKKPPLALVIVFVTALFIPTAITVAESWRVQDLSPYLYASAETVHQHSTRIKLLEKSCDDINKNVKEIKDEVKEQREEMKKQLEEIKKLIRDTQKKSG